MSKTHWKQLINPDYIGAYALPDGADLVVTIRSVDRKDVKGEGGRLEECTVAQLDGHKPFILNRTNQRTIESLYGPYIEDWAGKNITLYGSTTKLKGEAVECLRVRTERPALPSISDERLSKAIEKIKSGDYTIEQLNKGFSLTQQQKEIVECI